VKVLYLSGAVGIGGVETFLLNMAKMPGVESYFFLFQEGPLKKELEQRGAKVFLARSRFRLRNPLSWYFLAQEISGLCKRLEIACIHSSMAYAALVGSRAAKNSGLPHLWFQHGPVGGWMDRLAGKLKNDGILCNSMYTLEQQRKLTPEAKLIFMPLGTPKVEQPKFSERETLQVVMACRAQRWKGAHLFQEALTNLNDSQISGSLYLGDPESSYGQELAAAQGAQILPPTYNVDALFQGQDVLVNASITPEPFGLTLIEAMMRGIVPIAPNAGGPQEIIVDGESGFLFRSGDARDLAEKINKLKNIQVRRSMSKAARIRAEANYSLEAMWQRMLVIYQQLK
jgi:glycosyltransferase involved in cell wall biosynthesis